MKAIYLSIAIVTRNRPDSLNDTLYSLSNQTVHPAEIIVSDDSNIPELQKETADVAKRYGCKYYRGPKKGLYANRNFVAQKCTGTHFRTMDDDHQFPPDHIAKCVEAIMGEPDTIWTIGEYFPENKVRNLPPPIAGQIHPRGYSYTPKNLLNYYGISCGATIYPRTVIDKNILNMECYQFGMLYLEYGARLYKSGYTIKPLSKTYIIHHYNKNCASIDSSDTIRGAEIFSMLMFSFNHMKSFRNRCVTVLEIIKKVIINRYSLRIVQSAISEYNKNRKA